MAQVKIEEVVSHLDGEFKKALRDTFTQFAPDADCDATEAFKYFLKRVYHHCNVWESVPDSYIQR